MNRHLTKSILCVFIFFWAVHSTKAIHAENPAPGTKGLLSQGGQEPLLTGGLPNNESPPSSSQEHDAEAWETLTAEEKDINRKKLLEHVRQLDSCMQLRIIEKMQSLENPSEQLRKKSYENVNDALVLQNQAIARIDRYIDHVRRTSDRQALRLELHYASRELECSISLFHGGEAHADAARSMVKRGYIQRQLSEWDPAIRMYDQAAHKAKMAGAALVECQALIGNARAHLDGKKDPGAALDLVRGALSIVEHTKDDKCQFDAWGTMAEVQIAEGDYIGAADSINRAFAVLGDIKDHRDLYYGYLDRADIYQHFAERCSYARDRDFQICVDTVKLARRDYEFAYEAATRFGWDWLAQQARGFSASLKVWEDLFRLRQNLYEESLKEKVFSPERISDVLVTERFAAGASASHQETVLAWIERIGGIPPLTGARGAYIKGIMYEVDGQPDEAMTWYLRAADLLDQDRQFLHNERARGSYVEDKIELYYGAMLQLLDRRRYSEAFDLMERSRSRVMSDLLATNSLALSSSQERSLYGSLLQLRSEIAQLQACLFAARSEKGLDTSCRLWQQSVVNKPGAGRGAVQDDDGGTLTTADLTKLEAYLKERQAQYNDILGRMVKDTPQLARLVTSQPATLDKVEKVLTSDNSEMLTYVVLESQLIIWHIGPDSVHVRSVFLPRSVLKEKIERVRQSLVDPKQSYDQKTARELYLYLIAPMLPWIKSEHLVIVPHEDLHYLPFQALLNDQGNHYLGETFQISYAPSATVLVTLAGPSVMARPEVLAVADPSLRYAPAEVRAIMESFPGLAIVDTLADETDVKKLVAGKGLIHLAVHGKFAADEPLLSYLNLKEGKGEDGKLTAAEMYGLSLDAAKLVVLSACETGTVRATHANEVLGMVRGLLFAGADALLLSAWTIDDQATSQWMQAFYAAARTKPLAAAARTAIRDLKTKPGYQHPYYWSPFLLIGR